MAFQEFDGELDAAPGAAGFKEFTGELDAAPQPSLVERLKARFYKPATDAAPVDTTGADPMGTGATEILNEPNAPTATVSANPGALLERPMPGYREAQAKQYADAVQSGNAAVLSELSRATPTPAMVREAAYRNQNGAPDLKTFEPSATGNLLRKLDRKPLDNSLAGLAVETGADAARGAIAGTASIPAAAWGLVRAGADATGMDNVAGVAAGAGDAYRKFAGSIDGQDRGSLTRQVFESTFANLPIMLGLGFGNSSLAAMGAMSGAQAYDEARNAGISPSAALDRGAAHGVAEVLGERLALPALGRMFTKAVQTVGGRATSRELAEAMSEMLIKDQLGEQATTAMQDAYDKVGLGGTRRDMTLADYLDDAITTAKVSLGQSMLMAGGAGALRRMAGTAQAKPTRSVMDSAKAAPDAMAFTPMTDAANIATAPTVQPAPVNLLERQRPAPIRVEDQPTTPMTPEEILSVPTPAARIDVNNPEAVLAQLGLGQPAAPAAPEAANFAPITPAIAEESSVVPSPAADAPAQQTTDTSSESANEPQYKTRTAAAVNARRTGGAVVEVPGGFTVSPQPTTTGASAIQAQPAGTRGTVAADLLPATTPPVQQSNAATTEATPDQAPTTGAVRPAERAPIIPAARPAAVEARGAPAKPRKKITTIRGSSVLGAISTQLNGISPTLIADLSRKVQRTRTSKKTGKATQYTAWDNPLHSGYGQLFRSSGTSDLTEIARVLEEEGFIEKGALERDYLEARAQAEQIVKNELLNGGSTLRQGDAGSVEAEMQRRREMAQDDVPDDLFDGLTETDLAESGYADAPQEVKDLTESLLAQAEAEGIDTEALREDAARATEDQPDDAYQTALQDLARRAIEASRGQDGQADPSAARPGGEDRSQAAGSQGAESGSEGLTSPTAEELAAADKRARDADAADRAEQRRLADKATADAQRNEFTLTGSDRPADVAASAGQQDIFAPSAESDSPNDGEKQATSGARTGKIEDFGEKLAGARKDYAALLKDASEVDVAAEPLSKSWPEPDYQKLLDGGGDPFVVAFIHAARDEVPTKPQKSWKLKGWVDGVKLLRSVSQQLLAGEITKDALTEKLEAREFSNIKSAVGGRAELYQLVGHDKSLKGITLQKHHYTLYRGEQNVTKWAIEQKAKATAFSHWPREIAVADTKQEVLDQFKAKIASLDLGKKAKGQASQFVIYRKRGQTGAWIGKKIGREYIDLYKSDDVNAAREYLAENAEALEAKLAKYRETPFERNAENQPRVGDDHRNGAPVTPEVFADTFGFRGVQFGNYVEQERRQSDLNQAYDALMDMAAVLGITPRAISLGGRLGLAFGARGKGGKNAPAAHYEPGTVVINLTKGNGPGSLGHEWWHAVDNYFGREFGEGGFVTDGVRADKMRSAMQDAFRAVRVATQVALLRKRAAELDKRRSKPYWNTPLELSARSFESYLIAKLQDQGASNDYLANVVDEKVWNLDEAARAEFFGGEKVETYPYPGQAELPAVRAAFDEFFKTVEMRADDAGNVAMFSRNASYADAVESVLDGTTPESASVQISGSLPVLEALGLPGLPVVTTGDRLSKMHFDHGLTRADLKGLPAFLENPVLVFESATNPGSKVLVLDLWRRGKPVIAAIRPNVKQDRLDVNLLASAYPKDKPDQLGAWFRAGLLRYADKQKTQAWATSGGVQFPWLVQLRLGSVHSVIGPTDIGKSALSRSDPSDLRTVSRRVSEVESLVSEITSRWASAPEVVVVEDLSDPRVPEPIRAEDARQQSQGATGAPEGMFYAGKVYLVASELHGDADVVRVLFHEALGHAGLRGTFGKDLTRILDRLSLVNESKVRAKALQYGLDFGKQGDRRAAAEEVLAELAQTRPENGLVQSAIAAIRTFLREHIPGFSKMRMTDAEIVRSFILPARAWVERGGKAQPADSPPAFQRVWHGTPHRGIDKFSTDKIGTGEGNQSYGWGLYFASKKEIAEHYRKGLSYRDMVKQFRDEMPDQADMDETLEWAESGNAPPKMARVIKALAADDWLGFDYPSQALTALFREPESFDISPELKAAAQDMHGQLYEVEIPEDSEMLRWDKPLSEQPAAVRAALVPVLERWYGKGNADHVMTSPESPVKSGKDLVIALGYDKQASEMLREVGIKGIKYLDGTSRANGEGTHNYVIFDGADAQIHGAMFSRTSTVGPTNTTNTPAARKAKSPWLDTLGRAQFAPGAWAYSKIAPVINERLLTPLKLNAMPKELRGQLRAMKQQIEQAKEVAVKVAAEGFKLSEADRTLVSDIIEGEMAAGTVPPAHAARMAAGINAIMDQQTNDLVALGMLSRESAERWRGAYLPRFYRSKMMQTMREGGAALWALAARKAVKKPGVMQGMKGDGIKGRGLWQTVPADELKNWQALGWEVRDPTYEPDSSPDVQVWRDYSREERDKMGEIRDAGFRFTMGYLRTQRDIALGRLFASVAADRTLSAKDGRQPEGWVQVPDGSIPGTGGVKRYGKLAGMWVSKEVFNHLENHDQGISEAMRLYRKALGMWKEGKTVLNPVSHFNNMAGNISMAHFAGVSYWDAHKYAGAINDLVRNSPMVREAKEAGLFLGTMTQEELLATMPKELRALASMQASKTEAAADWVWNALSLWLRRPAGKLYEAEDQFFRYLIYRDARKRGIGQSDAVDYSQRYVFAYDDLPKGAKLIRDFGIPFFSYTYKAIPTLLHTATHYPHRMLAPAALMWGLNAAMYAIAAGEDDEDWVASIMAYLNDQERRKRAAEMEANERENLPPWMKGNSSLLGTPKAVRLGINESTQLPMFWDISQIMPGGNMFDVENNAGGIGWPQSMMPSHPLMTTMAAMFWNKDTFFGKDIVDDNDTAGERFEKRADWLWKQFTPAIAIGNYHTERLANVIAQMTGEPVRWLPKDATGVGKDGLPVQPELAALQTIGIKVRPIDTDLSEKIDKGQRAKMIRDIDAEMRRLRRLAQKGALSGRNLDAQEELARDKKQRLREGLTVDGEAR